MWQDKRDKVDFRNEILALSMIEHLNLVRLYGYLEQGDEQIILVEYVSNGTLRDHLDGKSSNYCLPNSKG
jgi:serine/threonine protein kinase